MYTPNATIFTPHGTPKLSPTRSSVVTTTCTTRCDTLTTSTLEEARAEMCSTPYDIRGVGAMHDTPKFPYAGNQFSKLGTPSMYPAWPGTIDGLCEELEEMEAAYHGNASAAGISSHGRGAVENETIEPRLMTLGAAGEFPPWADYYNEEDWLDCVPSLPL